MEGEEAVSAWWYVGAGFLIGLAVGVAVSPEALRLRALALQAARQKAREGPSLVSRVLGWLPFRVKLARASGAATRAGRKAYELAMARIGSPRGGDESL